MGLREVANAGPLVAAQNRDTIHPLNMPPPSASPVIQPAELIGKTRTQIRDLAKLKGLKPVGHPDASDGQTRKWVDPVTGKERLRLDRGHIDPTTGKPYNNPNAAADHVHGYNVNGGAIVDPVTNDPHFPTMGP